MLMAHTIFVQQLFENRIFISQQLHFIVQLLFIF